MPNQFFSPEGDLETYFVSEYWLIDQYIGDRLLVWGYSSDGALGNADVLTSNTSTPVVVFGGGTNWRQSNSGRTHKAAIKTDGTLWVWGDGGNGKLGNAIIIGSISTPVTTFAGGTNWKQVSSGTDHTAAIKTDGTLWVWGRNQFAQLGVNDITNRSTPITTFAGGTNWKQVDLGRYHTTAIKTDGTLWSWGYGSSGKLGNANITNRSTPVTTFAGGNNWKQVSGGYYHTAAIKTDGTLWVWGEAGFGALGNNSGTSPSTPVTTFAGGTNWIQVACGSIHTAAIKTNKTLWTWGSAGGGNLGNRITATSFVSTPITTFAGGTNWKQVSTGGYYTAAIKLDGTLWTWGQANFGRLGNGITIGNISTPITIFSGANNWKYVDCGYDHTAAIESGIIADYPLL